MKIKVLNPSLATAIAALALLNSQNSPSAAEVPVPNGGFDASADGWVWESWSAPGSAAGFDATLDSEGSATSGSLRLDSNFDGFNPDYQQAVYTFSLPEPINAGENYSSLSFDVRVDPTSIMRAEGDYGSIQVILRNGDSWDWADLPIKPLVDTEWRRFTFNFDGASGPIDAVRGITIKIAQTGFFGPVHLNLDNFAYGEKVIIDGFHTGEAGLQAPGWSWENWSAAGSTINWAPTDFDGHNTSGSALLNAAFEDLDGYQQAVFTFTLPAPVNAGLEYSHVNLDVKVEPSSTPRASGDYGFFEIILRNTPAWEWISTGPAETTGTRLTSTDWTHISMPVRSGEQVVGITVKLGENNFDGPVTLRIDNLSWTENTAPPAPPTLTISEGTSGLNMVATSADAYGRHNIYSVDSGLLGWYDAPDATTYEFSLLEFPDAAEYPGFQAHLFLVPGTPGDATSPDWNEPTLLFLDVKAGEGGTGNATLRWKVNEPGGNSQLYAEGLPVVESSTVLGTWKVTASNNNHLTITAPDGSTTETDLPTETAAAFAGGIRVYLGVQPNSTANIGQRARIGHVRVSQASTVWLEDDFTGETLDSLKWTINSPAGGVQLVPEGEAGYVLTWGLPDSGFFLQTTDDLSNGSWSGLAVTPVALGPLLRQAHIPGSLLPSEEQAFFRLVQRDQVGPTDHAGLAANYYTLTPEGGADWFLGLTLSDDTTGFYSLSKAGQPDEFGTYSVTRDPSQNRWVIALLPEGAAEESLHLEFTAAAEGVWSYAGAGSNATGAFTAESLLP